MGKGFYHEECLLFLGGGEGPRDRLPHCVDQKISDWLINVIFLDKAETAIISGIKSMYGITGINAN